MKKFISICFALVMCMSMSVTAFANVGGFVESISNKKAPELVEAVNESEDCDARLVITPYADRETLPTDLKEKIEEAYEIIKATPNLTGLNEKVSEIAKEMGIDVTDLAVSDMFDIRMTDCDTHDLHGHFDVTLKSDSLKDFVCLLHYHGDFWHIVEGAEVTHEGTHIEFDAMEFSPFAIVVNAADEAEESSQPDATVTDGDNTGLFGGPHNHILCWLIIIILLLLIIVLLLTKKDKKDKK